MVRRMLPAQPNHNALPAAVQRFVILRSDSQDDTSLPTLTRKSEAVDPDEIAGNTHKALICERRLRNSADKQRKLPIRMNSNGHDRHSKY
jgi:hypothetical protein